MVFYLLFVVLECLETFFFHFWYHLKMIHDVKTILSLSIFFSICSSSFCQWSNPFMLCWSFKYFSFLAGKCSWSDCWSLLGGLGVANRILFYFLSSELLADNHFYLLMTASQIDYLFFYFGVFGMDSVSFLSMESVAGRITASTSFVRPNILSLLFKLLFDKVRKLTCLISGSTGKLTNILTAIM